MIQTTQSNIKYDDLSAFLNIESIDNPNVKDKLYKKLKNSLIPKWNISHELYGINDPSWNCITQTMKEKYTKKFMY